MSTKHNKKKKGYIFQKENNQYGYHRNTSKFWRRHRDNLGLPRIRLHDIRHTYITLSIQKGINLLTVSKMVGHSNIRTTMKYIHTDNQFISDYIESKLNK